MPPLEPPVISLRRAALAPWLATLTFTAAAATATEMLEFAGVLESGGQVRIMLVDKTKAMTSPWMAVGDTFAGHTFRSFDAADETALLSKDGKDVRLRLATARVRHGEAMGKLSPKTALAIFHNVRQIHFAAEQYYIEHGKATTTLQNLVGAGKYIGRLVVVAGEDYSTITLNRGQPVALSTAGGDVIPAEAGLVPNATYAFHPVRPGDTGMKIAQTAKISITELMALNEGVNFNKLSPGQVLRVK